MLTLKIGTLIGVFVLAGATALFAQDHSQHQAVSQEKTAQAAAPEAIFCPTMKTGQLCSHGTADNLQLSGEKAEQWIASARKYNRAVNSATEELLQDAEGLLAPAQMDLLKAWFAVGLNPEINQLLYGKGLMAKKE